MNQTSTEQQSNRATRNKVQHTKVGAWKTKLSMPALMPDMLAKKVGGYTVVLQPIW
jgi:hypothetical protein